MTRLLALGLVVGCGAAPEPRQVALVAPPEPPPRPPPAWHWSSPTTGADALFDVWSARDVAIAVGDHGVVLRSTDGGVGWTRATPTDAPLRHVHGGAHGDVFASGDVVLVSHDRGLTWSELTSPAPNVGAVWTDGDHTIVLGASSALHRSIDRGKTWTRVYEDTRCGRFDYVGEAGGRLWAGGNCLVSSVDQGASWQGALDRQTVRFPSVWEDDGNLVALASENYTANLLESRDQGATWQQKTYFSVALQHTWGDTLGRMLVGETGAMRRTLDHGAHWYAQAVYELTAKLTGVAASGGALVTVASDGIVRRSVDGGSRWTTANAVTDVDLRSAWMGDDGVAFAGGVMSATNRTVLLRSADHGATWARVEGVEGRGMELVWGTSPTDVIVGLEAFTVRSADGGKSWTTGKEFGEWHAMARDGHGALFALGSYSFHHSTDGGATWKHGRISEQSLMFDALSCTPTGTLLAVGREHVARSTDVGATWSVTTYAKAGLVSAIATTARAAVIVTSDGLYRSTDDGVTFTPVLPAASWRDVAVTQGVFWAVGDGRVAHSIDDGNTWSVEDFPSRSGGRLAADARGHLIVVGRGGTILRYPR